MRVLLDTHIALWLLTDSPKLSEKARALIISAGDQVYVSAVSIWEISIKHRLLPTKMPISGQMAKVRFAAAGLQFLPISAEHAAQVDTLDLHHRDPFDRILIAQSRCEPLHLLTRDAQLAIYSELVVLV
jgi:PIN domain nuclease of toxin-antitoxin system